MSNLSDIITDLEDKIEGACQKDLIEHLKKQPYSINCATCGAELTCDAKIDSDNDLNIEVLPCPTCCTEED